MSMSKDLFLALLSMDAYNRGYGAGLSDSGRDDHDGLGETKNISGIGNATVSYTLADADLTDQAQAAGFYAVAYDVSGVAGFADGFAALPGVGAAKLERYGDRFLRAIRAARR